MFRLQQNLSYDAIQGSPKNVAYQGRGQNVHNFIAV